MWWVGVGVASVMVVVINVSERWATARFSYHCRLACTAHVVGAACTAHMMTPAMHTPQVEESRRSAAEFLTSLCAIIGGVFTVLGLFDSVVYHSVKAALRVRVRVRLRVRVITA